MQWHGIARSDLSVRTTEDTISNAKPYWRDDVTFLSVRVDKQCDPGRTVRVIFNRFYACRDTCLVAFEINNTIALLMTATLMAHGDPAVIITTTILALFLKQWLVWFTLVQMRGDNLYQATAAG